MAKYRDNLPQLGDTLFLTDGGLETTLVFHDGLELPCFAAFALLDDARGRGRLDDYFRRYAAIALDHGLGFILESATWRANRDWGARLGYSEPALERINHRAIEHLIGLRDALECDASPIVVSGCIGPRGDGYVAATQMAPDAAERYHRPQVESLCAAGADLVTAMTLTHSAEAIGIARAAAAAGIPVALSFTVETDGRLPSGEALGEAIEAVEAATGASPGYYMINCAHPSHFADVIATARPWVRRLRGIRANASTRSHAELDAAETLDAGDPDDLGTRYRELRRRLPQLTVLGGCCGTDDRHIDAICAACVD